MDIYASQNFAGTRPWSKAAGDQRIDDGLIEVIGLSTYQLPFLQVSVYAYNNKTLRLSLDWNFKFENIWK